MFELARLLFSRWWSCYEAHAFLCTDCPPTLTITPSAATMAVGDVLTCNSDTSLSSYMFTDVVRASTAGNTVTLTEAGLFSFTCTSTVAMASPCSARASVIGTSVGKKQNSSDHCWFIYNLPVEKEITVVKIWYSYVIYKYFVFNYTIALLRSSLSIQSM